MRVLHLGLVCLCVLLLASPGVAGEWQWALALHGGAGTIPRDLDAALADQYRASLRAGLEIGRMCDLSARRAGGCLKQGAMALLLMLGAAGGALGAPPDARGPAAPGSVASADAMLSVSDSPEFWWPVPRSEPDANAVHTRVNPCGGSVR